MNDIFLRSKQLIGEENYHLISTKKIAVLGLGGVGGTALETLARSGFKNFIIVDFDVVDISNLNRQIMYTQKDIGVDKVQACKERILSINNKAKIETYSLKISENNIDFLSHNVDFVVDAIDDLNAKVATAEYCLKNNIPFISSMGMANKINPHTVEIIRLDKTTSDPLAKKFRYEIKRRGLPTNNVMTVSSTETPIRKDLLSSMMMVPSSAGLNIASFILSYFIKKDNQI